MHELLAEGHPSAIEVCERDCILLDCDPVEDRDKALFSSILANVRLQEVDKDFLADKLGQIKLVRQFHVPSLLTTPTNTNTCTIAARVLRQ